MNNTKHVTSTNCGHSTFFNPVTLFIGRVCMAVLISGQSHLNIAFYFLLQTPTLSLLCTVMASAYLKPIRASKGAASIPCSMRSSTSMCPLNKYLLLPWCSRLSIIPRSTLAVGDWERLFLDSIRLILGRNSGSP